MPIKKYILILTIALIISMFLERYCFAMVIYKTRNYGAILIFLVVLFNSIFLRLIQNLRITKHKKRLHEMYRLDNAPAVGSCAIFCIG